MRGCQQRRYLRFEFRDHGGWGRWVRSGEGACFRGAPSVGWSSWRAEERQAKGRSAAPGEETSGD